MTQSLVITAIGEDRPGIVNDLTEILLDASLNIEDSRMSILGGEFALILLVSGNAESISSLNAEQGTLEQRLKLKLLIKPTSQKVDRDDTIPYLITVEGMDNPGIVHKLAHYLSQQSINITNLQTHSSHAAHTGTPMFSVDMQVDIPASADLEQIQDGFDKTCDELSMDAEFTVL